MRINLLRSVTVGGLLTVTSCAMEPPPLPVWSPPAQYQYPVYAPSPAQPTYSPPPAVAEPPVMEAQVPSPADNSGRSWSRDLTAAGIGAVAGSALAKGFGTAAGRQSGVVADDFAGGIVGGLEGEEGAAAFGGLIEIILEDGWLLAL